MAIINGPEIQQAATLLRKELVDPIDSFGYDRPTSSSMHSCSTWQPAVAPPGSDSLFSKEALIRPHVADAITKPSPFVEPGTGARPSLKAAVRYTASFAGDSRALADDRVRKQSLLCKISRSAPMRRAEQRLQGLRSPAAARVQSAGVKMALMAAMSIAAGLPDIEMYACQVAGFGAVGDYADSGFFRACERPATKTFEGLDHAEQISTLYRKLATKAKDPLQYECLATVTMKTKKEAAKGLTSLGPSGEGYTSLQVDKLLGKDEWHPLERFAIQQGFDEFGQVKWRCCDNAKLSGTNACVSTHETIACEDASFPALVAHLFAQVWEGHLPPFHMCTDDVDSAYRRMLCSDARATVVAFYNTDVGEVRFATMDGHNFGLVSAVLSWNRHSRTVSELARRFFGVCNADYFDDHCTCEPVYAGVTGKVVLHALYDWLGIPLATGVKDVPYATHNPFLGVVSDFSLFQDGVVVMRSKPDRIARLIVDCSRFIAQGFMESGEGSSFVGKLEFTALSAGSHRLGRAAIAALRRYMKGCDTTHSNPWWPQALEALQFFVVVLARLPPRMFRVRRPLPKRGKILLYTDAMYKWVNGVEVSVIGIAIYDPDPTDGSPPRWVHAHAPVPEAMLAQWGDRKTKIMLAEAIAPAVAVLSLPDLFRDREVVSFIDNTGALYAYARGSSRDVETSRLVHIFHACCAAMSVLVWFEYVPSGANLADLPSRGEFELLNEFGSIPFEIVWPTVGEDWLHAIDRIFAKHAPPRTRREKRWRAEVTDETARAAVSVAEETKRQKR